jgi:hypothetical protein
MIDVNGANVRCTPLLVPHKSPQHRRPDQLPDPSLFITCEKTSVKGKLSAVLVICKHEYRRREQPTTEIAEH